MCAIKLLRINPIEMSNFTTTAMYSCILLATINNGEIFLQDFLEILKRTLQNLEDSTCIMMYMNNNFKLNKHVIVYNSPMTDGI